MDLISLQFTSHRFYLSAQHGVRCTWTPTGWHWRWNIFLRMSFYLVATSHACVDLLELESSCLDHQRLSLCPGPGIGYLTWGSNWWECWSRAGRSGGWRTVSTFYVVLYLHEDYKILKTKTEKLLSVLYDLTKYRIHWIRHIPEPKFSSYCGEFFLTSIAYWQQGIANATCWCLLHLKSSKSFWK